MPNAEQPLKDWLKANPDDIKVRFMLAQAYDAGATRPTPSANTSWSPRPSPTTPSC